MGKPDFERCRAAFVCLPIMVVVGAAQCPTSLQSPCPLTLPSTTAVKIQ